GLASKRFRAVGRFGIGFFSVFMLGQNVQVTTRRFSRAYADGSDQWFLEFEAGLDERPTLSQPHSSSLLKKHGTRVSVATDRKTLERLMTTTFDALWDTMDWDTDRVESHRLLSRSFLNLTKVNEQENFRTVITNLCPTLDVKVSLRMGTKNPVTIVTPNDW